MKRKKIPNLFIRVLTQLVPKKKSIKLIGDYKSKFRNCTQTKTLTLASRSVEG